jgi:hypothetical protein
MATMATMARPAAVTRRWRGRVVRSLGLLLLLLGAYAGLHALAENVANSVSVSVRTSPDLFNSTSVVIFARTINDVHVAQQAQAAVNSTALTNPLDNYSCPLGSIHPLYRYHIEFRLQGVLIEVADVDTSGCEWWSITALGMPALLQRLDLYPSRVLPTLHLLTGMPIPPP